MAHLRTQSATLIMIYFFFWPTVYMAKADCASSSLKRAMRKHIDAGRATALLKAASPGYLQAISDSSSLEFN